MASGTGALSLAQIFHGGMFAPEAITGERPVSASENTISNDSQKTSRELSQTEIEDIPHLAMQPQGCAKAGFDGIELYGAHGYLICQFLGRKQTGGKMSGEARFSTGPFSDAHYRRRQRQGP